ncbi:MAG: alginate export family protein, partial [Bacteroidia bacterium]|nr:alginate export family protein [Bacteroidia bacterium]
LKIGRQELVYDDVRLLGNLDWLQQARRHDAMLLKFEHKGWKVHVGGAYNQNAERKAGTVYNGVPTGYPAGSNGIGALYKSMQFLYASKKLKSATLSYLFFKDDFSRYHFADTDIDKTQPLYERKAWSRVTTGFNLFGNVADLSYAASAFYQGGKYRDGTRLNEYLLSASASYAFTRKLSAGAGVDVTSGNNGADPAHRNQRFDPLYGTPHKFWGHMDYFYVADGFGPNGLTDAYVKMKFEPAPSVRLLIDVHQFVLPNALPEGTELSKKPWPGNRLCFQLRHDTGHRPRSRLQCFLRHGHIAVALFEEYTRCRSPGELGVRDGVDKTGVEDQVT